MLPKEPSDQDLHCLIYWCKLYIPWSEGHENRHIKHCRSRSDCSQRNLLIRIYTVWYVDANLWSEGHENGHIKHCRFRSECSQRTLLIRVYIVWYVDCTYHDQRVMRIDISNTVDPDQIAPEGNLWSGSTLFDMLMQTINTMIRVSC